MRFKELSSNGQEYVGFKAPNSISANSIWILPDADGSSGEAMVTDGAGVLSWTLLPTTFLQLTDTPSNYTGDAARLLFVNDAEDAVAFASNAKWNETYDRLQITSFYAHGIRSIRSTQEVNISGSACKLTHQTGGNMGDGFGVAVAFAIKDAISNEEVVGNLQCVRDGADDSGQFRFKIWAGGTPSITTTFTKSMNMLIGDDQTTEPSSMTKGVVLYTGTAPSNSVPDTFSMWAADANGAATAAPHFRTEDGKVIKLYQSLSISDPVEFGSLTINSIEIVGTDGEVNKAAVEDSANWDAAYAHISSVGTDRGYIDQDVQTTASPTFVNITGTSFIIGANTLDTTEWAHLDGLDQAVGTGDSVTFAGLTVTDIFSEEHSSQHSLLLGYYAGKNQAAGGLYNIAIGGSSMYWNQTGDYNVVIGYQTGYGASSQNYDYNVFIGAQAGFANKTGDENVAIGYRSLMRNETGSQNICIGKYAGTGVASNSHSYNVLIGLEAGYKITTGTHNFQLGFRSAYNMSTANYNIGIGSQSLFYNETGIYNVAIGYRAGYGATGQNMSYQVLIGALAGDAITTGTYNVCIGYESGTAITTGSRNVLMGYRTGRKLTTPSYNFFLGFQVGGNATTSHETVGIGGNVFASLTTGYNLVAIGYAAGNAITTGHDNTFLGEEAGYAVTTGNNNTMIGAKSGLSITTTNGGVFIGYSAGSNETTADKLYIDNSNTATPLIWGDFSNNYVAIYDHLCIGSKTPSDNADITLDALGCLCMKEITTPTADADYGKVYTKNDNKLYFQDGAGTEHEVAFV